MATSSKRLDRKACCFVKCIEIGYSSELLDRKSKPATMEEYPVDFIPQETTEYVFTTHIKDPEHFYVHVESRSKILDDIMEALAERYFELGPSDKVLAHKRLGSLCAAKFTDDDNWYRARITGLMKTGMIEVQFVDYGNTDYVSDDRVKSLDADLVCYPVQSYRCCLANISSSQGYWSPESTINFEDKTMDQRCQAYFAGKMKDDTYLVDMIDGEGNSLNQMFGAKPSKAGQKNSSGSGSFKALSWEKGSKVQTTVAYVQSPDLFWCQDQSFANELLILSEELSRLHMTQSIEPLSEVRPGVICAAKFSEDEAWYRGVVKAVSQGEAQVYFVDFGNTESVPLDLICRLNPGMDSMPALAARCRLAGIAPRSGDWDPHVVEEFEELVVDKEFELTVVDREGDSYVVSLVDIVENTDVSGHMKSLVGEMTQAGAGKNKSNNNQAVSAREVTGIGPSLSVGLCVEAFLTWVDSPGDFWVQLKDFDHLVQKLSNELQEFYGQPRPGAAVAPGAFIVARYSEDDMWYRGLILKEVSDSEVLVLFIDYGNSDTVVKSDLRQVAPAFGEVVPLAFRCALVGVKALEGGKAWTTDARSFIEELTQDGCQCEVMDETESRKLVRLIANGKDVATELVALRVVSEATSGKAISNCPKFTRYETVSRSESLPVTVTHVGSPQEFWCQLSKNAAQMDGLMEKLELHYSDEGGTMVRDATVGRACIAQYSEDNAWYRAAILGSSQSGFSVQFVDYGNSEVVSANLVCEPEPRFLDLPVQAVCCRLPLQGDTTHLADAMSDLVMDKELQMEVMEVRDGVAVVELYDGSTKVSDLLKKSPGQKSPAQKSPAAQNSEMQYMDITPASALTPGFPVMAFSSLVVSPSKFYLQLADKEEQLGSLMDDISVFNASVQGPQPLPSARPGQACMALFSEDNQWYRAVVLSSQGPTSTVLFVDYGNEEQVNTDTLRILPAELGVTPIMAYECSLDGTEGTVWSDEAKQFFESIIMDQELRCTFLSQKSVKIIANDKDLREELARNGHCKPKESATSPRAFGGPKVNGGSGSSPVKSEGSSAGFGKERRPFGGRDNTSDGEPSNKGFGSRDRNESSGFGSKKGETGSGFGAGRSENGSGFGSGRSQGGSGFGSDRGEGGGRRERRNSGGSNAATEFTYTDPPSDPETALLVHMDEDGTFYLQLPSMERDILFLAKRLAGSYKNGGGPRLKDTPAKGVVCCAKFPEDGCMYRALIVDVSGGNALLRYVDYGNTAECSTRDLKMLFPDLLQYTVQAFPCKLKGLEWSVDQAEKFASATLDQNLEVTFSGSSPPFEVEVKTPGGDLLDILTGKVEFKPPPQPSSDAGQKPKSGFGGGSASPKKSSSGGGGGFGGGGFGGASKTPPKANSAGVSPSPAPPKICEQKFAVQEPPKEQVDAYICHVDEAGYFYLQLEKDTGVLDSIMADLESLPNLGQHPDTSPGFACAAVFSEDSAWYRARIASVEGDNLTVTFADYGNGDVVKKSAVKPLSDSLLAHPPLAYQSQFSDLGPLSEDAQTKLSEYLMEHKVTATFTNSAAPYSVQLLDTEGNSLQDIVCPSDCYKAQPCPKAVVPAGVAHIEDDGRFYIQLYADFPAIADLQRSLTETRTAGAEKLDGPETGSACLFELDEGTCHRGQIIEVTGASALVKDMDSGKTHARDCASLHKLPLEFFKRPPFGYECRLKGVESWTGDLREKFTEMTDGKILNATFYTSASPFRVSLARSIELDLLGLSAPAPDSPVREKPAKAASKPEVSSGAEVYITHIDNDGTLYIQTASKEDDLNSMSERLETALESAATGDLSVAQVGGTICARFTEDDAWYRALVESTDTETSQVNVRFVDYGNTDTVGADRVATLPSEFELSELPPFARKSRLAVELTAETVEKLREVVLDQALTLESSESHGDYDEVELNLAGAPLTESLNIPAAKEDEFADASETATTEAALNKNTNAEVEEFTDAVETMEAGVGVKVDQMEAQEVQTQESGSSGSASSSSSRMSVTVSYAVTPSQFYFQVNGDQTPYDALMVEMYEYFSALPEGEGAVVTGEGGLAVGDLCAALYAEDESWYRVKVTYITDGSYTILFIDHGNTEVAQPDTLRQLPEQFRSLPAAAKLACLAGVKPVEEEWTEEAITEFKTMVEEKSLLADILAVKDDVTTMRLLELGIPVHEELIKKEHGVPSEETVAASDSVQHVFSDANDTFQESRTEDLSSHLNNNDDAELAKDYGSPKSGMKIGSVANMVEELKDVSVFVSHTISPSLFWCRLSTCVEVLLEISNFLGSTYEAGDELKLSQEASVGDLVVARNSSDGLFYRSRVVTGDTDSDRTKLLQYIDFGTEGEADSDQLYCMEPDMYKFPAQAFCCSLDNVRPQQGDKWSDSACQAFSDLVRDTELLLKLVGRDNDGTLLVELVDPQTGMPVSARLAEAGFGAVLDPQAVTKDSRKGQDSSRPGDVTALENLETFQPILESTAMAGDTTQAITQPYTVEGGDTDGFKTVCLSLHTEYDVTICQDELPSSFHVRLLEMDTQLTALAAEIEAYIASEEEAQDFSPKVDDVCLVRHNGVWHRATLLKQLETSWNVKLQDVGLEVCVEQTELKHLPARLLELPAQAVPCYLAGVVSVEPEWCSGAVDFFKDFVKDSKFCMYVLEDAHKGKYGVCMNELDSTESNSVNRAMVDLGYAEVVPGSNIDVQIEMEKTLDTDMLNELEESFNDVSLMRCNADNDKLEEGATEGAESGDPTSYCESYKESELSRSCKKGVDPSVYQLLPLADLDVESAKLGDPGTANADQEVDTPGDRLLKKFSLAEDVKRIEQDGCPDRENSDGEVDYLASEMSVDGSTDASKAVLINRDSEVAVHSVCRDPGMSVDGSTDASEAVHIISKDSAVAVHSVCRDPGMLESCPEAEGKTEEEGNASVEDSSKETSTGEKSGTKNATDATSPNSAPSTKSIYTWKKEATDTEEFSNCDGVEQHVDAQLVKGNGDAKEKEKQSQNQKAQEQGNHTTEPKKDTSPEWPTDKEETLGAAGDSCKANGLTNKSDATQEGSELLPQGEEIEGKEMVLSKAEEKTFAEEEKNNFHEKNFEKEEEKESKKEEEKAEENKVDGEEQKNFEEEEEHDLEKVDGKNFEKEEGKNFKRAEENNFEKEDKKNSEKEEEKDFEKEGEKNFEEDEEGVKVNGSRDERPALVEPSLKSMSHVNRPYMSSTPSKDARGVKTKARQKSGEHASKLCQASTAHSLKYGVDGTDPPEDQTEAVDSDISDEETAQARGLELEEDISALEAVDVSNVGVGPSPGSNQQLSSSDASTQDQSSQEGTHFISCLDADEAETGSSEVKSDGHPGPSRLREVDDRSDAEVEGQSGGGVGAGAVGERPTCTDQPEDREPDDKTCADVRDTKLLDCTVDEYESCSEVGQEDAGSVALRKNKVNSIRERIATENLSTSSVVSGPSWQASDFEPPSSLVLSGSSFDASVFTENASTLGDDDDDDVNDYNDGDEEEDEEKVVEGMLNHPEAKTSDSSSSVSSPSASDESQQGLESSGECPCEFMPEGGIEELLQEEFEAEGEEDSGHGLGIPNFADMFGMIVLDDDGEIERANYFRMDQVMEHFRRRAAELDIRDDDEHNDGGDDVEHNDGGDNVEHNDGGDDVEHNDGGDDVEHNDGGDEVEHNDGGDEVEHNDGGDEVEHNDGGDDVEHNDGENAVDGGVEEAEDDLVDEAVEYLVIDEADITDDGQVQDGVVDDENSDEMGGCIDDAFQDQEIDGIIDSKGGEEEEQDDDDENNQGDEEKDDINIFNKPDEDDKKDGHDKEIGYEDDSGDGDPEKAACPTEEPAETVLGESISELNSEECRGPCVAEDIEESVEKRDQSSKLLVAESSVSYHDEEDNDDDDAYIADPEPSAEPKDSELCVEDEVVAGAASLRLEDDKAGDGSTITREGQEKSEDEGDEERLEDGSDDDTVGQGKAGKHDNKVDDNEEQSKGDDKVDNKVDNSMGDDKKDNDRDKVESDDD